MTNAIAMGTPTSPIKLNTSSIPSIYNKKGDTVPLK